MLDEVDRLTVEGWGEGKCTKCLKGAWNEKMRYRNKNVKGGMLGIGVGALKKKGGAVTPLQTI